MDFPETLQNDNKKSLYPFIRPELSSRPAIVHHQTGALMVDGSKLWSLSEFKPEKIENGPEDGPRKFVQEHTHIIFRLTAPAGTQDDDDVFLAPDLDLPIVLRSLSMPNMPNTYTYTYIGPCLSLISEVATHRKWQTTERPMADWRDTLRSMDMDGAPEGRDSRKLGEWTDNKIFWTEPTSWERLRDLWEQVKKMKEEDIKAWSKQVSAYRKNRGRVDISEGSTALVDAQKKPEQLLLHIVSKSIRPLVHNQELEETTAGSMDLWRETLAFIEREKHVLNQELEEVMTGPMYKLRKGPREWERIIIV
jgi:hypothetical protein